MDDLLKEKIYIDEKGEEYISIACRQYNAIAIIFILVSAANLVLQLMRFFKYGKETYHNWINIFNFYIAPFIIITQVLLTLAQLYYYYNGVMSQKKALAGSDRSLFNKSFVLYRNGNSFGIASMLIGLIYLGIFIYQAIQAD